MRLLWRVVRFEAGLWRSLFLLAVRRRDGVRAGVTGFGYHRGLASVWLPLVGVAAVEVPLVHLMVPHPVVRLALLAIGVWGVTIMLGIWAAHVVRPYLVGADGIRLRHGLSRDLRLPWSAIASVDARTTTSWREHGIGAATTVQDGRLGYLVTGETRVVLRLAEPMTVPAGRGRTAEITEIHLGADEPEALLAALRVRVPAVRPR